MQRPGAPVKTNRYDVTVQWGDCDPARIVFYPQYFRWFDGGTTELFAAVGLPLPELYAEYDILGIPILDAGAKFMRPSRFRDVITIVSGIESWGRSSFRLRHEVLNGGETAAVGHEVRAWVAEDAGRPGGIRALPVPGPVRARFESG